MKPSAKMVQRIAGDELEPDRPMPDSAVIATPPRMEKERRM
jgi:hypothetical protein